MMLRLFERSELQHQYANGAENSKNFREAELQRAII